MSSTQPRLLRLQGPARLWAAVPLLLLLLAWAPPARASAPAGEPAPAFPTEEAPARGSEEGAPGSPPAEAGQLLPVETLIPPPPSVEEAPAPLPVVKEVVESITAPLSGEAPESPVAAPNDESTAETVSAQSPAQTVSGASQQAGEPVRAVEHVIAPAGPPPPGAGPGPASAAPATVRVSALNMARARARAAVAQRARRASCQLSSLGAQMTEACVRGELGRGPAGSTPAISFSAPNTLLGVSGHAGARGLKNPPAAESPASVPPRNPAPTGGGAGAAAGGAGAASGASLAVVALLLLTAPAMTRRLRLPSCSWRTFSFVLIAERPG